MANVRTIGMRKIDVNVTTAGTAVPISATTLFATEFEVHVPNGNAGMNIYVGDSTVDNTWIPRNKGTTNNFSHGTGSLDASGGGALAFDLNKIYIDADANGDDAIVQYLAFDNPS